MQSNLALELPLPLKSVATLPCHSHVVSISRVFICSLIFLPDGDINTTLLQYFCCITHAFQL